MKTLKQNLSAKLKKQGGFTLIEMLIVVAIIAILIAISIPMVGGALTKAKNATDAANVRAACAEAAIYYLTNDATDFGAMVYDAPNGKLESDASGLTSYAKANTGYVWVKVDGGVVNWIWSEAEPAAGASWNTGTPVTVPD